MESFLRNLDNGASLSQIIRLLESITKRFEWKDALVVLTSIINNLQERRGPELEDITPQERFAWFKCIRLIATLYEERDNAIRLRYRREGIRQEQNTTYVITPGSLERREITIRICV